MIQLRPEVQEFAEEMERRLQANDAGKGTDITASVKSLPLNFLLGSAIAEICEMVAAKGDISEAADAANFLMMYAIKSRK